MMPEPLFNIFGIDIDTARDTILIIGLFAIALGLMVAVFTQSIYDFIANPGDGFKITGKMTFLGGLLGGVISYLAIYFIYVYVINPKLSDKNIFKSDMNKGVWELLRFVPISITLAHAFGRIGCFCAGCCGGIATDLWFGIQFPGEHVKHIPTQLFEAIFLFLISAAMIVLYFKFIIEFFRADSERGEFIPGLTPSQFWSILMVIGGVVFFFLYRYFDKKISTKNYVIE